MKFQTTVFFLFSALALSASTAFAGYYSDGEHVICNVDLTALNETVTPEQAQLGRYAMDVLSFGSENIEFRGKFTNNEKVILVDSLPAIRSIREGKLVSKELKDLDRKLTGLRSNAARVTLSYAFPNLSVSVEFSTGERLTSTVVRDVSRGAYHGGGTNQLMPEIELADSKFGRDLGLNTRSSLKIQCF